MSPSVLYGIGVDISHVPRFAALLARASLVDRFAAKMLHSNEIRQFQQITRTERARFLASRWSAKEAATKAIGQRLLFPEMELVRDQSGDPRPRLRLHGAAREACAVLGVVSELPLASVSHDADYAIACVIVHRSGKSAGR